MGVKQTIEQVARLREIAVVFLELELHHFIDIFSLKHHLPWHRRFHTKTNLGNDAHTHPETVRQIFERLGGGFLKLGQLLALRPDLVGVEYAKSFEKLLDHVEPLEWDELELCLEECLPKGIKSFKRISKKAIASGSIAQVHKANLHDGTTVAVKIRRPNIEKRFKSDISILYSFTKILGRRYNIEFMNPEKVIEEFETYTLKELDLTHEARNMAKFTTNFAGEKSVHIPKIYPKLSNEKILVIEFIEGEHLLEERSLKQNREVIKKLTDAVFKQLFVDGFFHADLHPGNIFVIPNNIHKRNSSLKIAFLDFGIVGYIDSVLKDQIAELFVALISGSLEKTANALINLNVNNSNPPLRDIETGIYHAIGEYYNLPIGEIPIAKMLNDCIDVARKNNISLPAQMVLFSKSLLTLEGSCRELDPSFNIVESAKPYVEKMLTPKFDFSGLPKKTLIFLHEGQKLFGRVPSTLQGLDRKLSMLENRMGTIDQTFHYLSHVVWRVSKLGIYSLLFASFLLSASILIHTGPMYYDISIYSIVAVTWALLLLFLIILNLKDATDIQRKK
ncbi:hypothetical protein CL619_01015 [archaeon]|nr:hypothetical protein [archaeon]|tara:strand:- start:6629 stop:8314 length:1686 start_codon:yes stop_codon:yes gene_type:complete